MDLSLSPVEREFRDAVRDWIEANHPGREPDSDPELFEFRRAWQRALNDRGWAGLTWPTEYGGAGATHGRAGDLLRGGRARGRSVDGQRARPGDGRPDGHRPRHRGAEAALPGADPVGRRDLVPGLLRAGVGLGPRVAQDARRAQRRRVDRHRPEGVDDVRARGEVVHARGAHRPGGGQAPRADLLPARHGAGRRRGPAARADHRRVRVQRAVPRGGPDPAREHRRRRGQRLAGGDHHAHARARGPGLRAPGARAGRAARAARRDPRGGAATATR